MKSFIRKIIVLVFFKKPIRRYSDTHIKGKDSDFTGYLLEVLRRDESRMIGSKAALIGWYDLDIEINREMQNQLIKYERDQGNDI